MSLLNQRLLLHRKVKGEIAATKVVNNKKPKLGEEIEYRISFHNTVENGKLEEVRVEDTIPKGLEYVENSIYRRRSTWTSRISC